MIKAAAHLCTLCQQKADAVDYKDSQWLRQYLSSFGGILPARKTGMCALHQKALGLAIKRARFMALLPKV